MFTTSILRFRDLQKICKVGRQTLVRWEERGQFPKRIRFGDNRVGWKREEVDKWMQDKMKERDV